MAKTRDYMDYLDESIGIAPAHSQEEYQASEVISQIMKEHGLETAVEEFDSAGTGVMARNVLAIVLFVTLLVAGLVPDTLHIVMLLVAFASAGLLTFMRFVRNIFENIGPARRSQNVVAVRRARNQNTGRTSRPIVIVAHYDTPREEPMRRGGLARYQSMLVRVGVFCPAVVCVTVLFQLLGFLPEGFRMFMWVVGLIACLPAVVLAVTSLMGRFGNCTVGANNNKSSIAAMLTLVDKISPAEDRATDAARSRPRPRREVRLQETPEIQPTRQSEQVVEEVKGVRHGEEVLRSLGILPASCEITYEQPRVVVEDEQIEVAENPYDEASEAVETEFDEQYDDYEDYDEDSYDSDYEDEYDGDYDDEYDEDYADDYDDVESEEKDETDKDESHKPERRVVRLTDDESDDEELSDDYDDYDEEYDDDEYDDEDEEFEDDQDGTPIGSSIGAWFSERIDKFRSRFGSKDEDDSDGWIDEDEEYEEDVEEESFEDEEEDYDLDSEDIDEQDEEQYDDEYDDELEDDFDEDEDYNEDEEEPSDEEYDYEGEFDYDDPDADYDDDEEYEYDEEDDQRSDDGEASWEEYDEQEEDPDAVADLAHDAEAEEDYESDFEYDDDDDDLYPSSSFEPIELPDDEEYEEEDEVDSNPPKRRPLFGRLLRRKSDPEPIEVVDEEEEVYEDQSDEPEANEEEAPDVEDDFDSDDMDVEYLDDDVDDESDDYSDEEFYDDELYEDGYDEEEYYEEEIEEEPEENEPEQKRPSFGQRILGLFRGKRTEDSHAEDLDEGSDEYYLEEEDYDEEYDGEYYDDDDYEEEDAIEDDQGSSIEEDSPVSEYADDYDEYDDQLSTYDDEEQLDDEYVNEDDAVEPPIPIAAPEPVRPPDPNMLHFDREEDDDIPERDDSGINTITDNYDLLSGDIPRESQRERPAAIDDPTWGTSTYQPTRPSYNIARRAALYDLPDPSGATVDPLADEYEYTEDVPSTQDEAQHMGGRVGFWGDDDSAQSTSWKGGATLRDDLRDDPYESAEDDLKDAMLDMGDEFLDEHDVWFVATGASEAEHGGMKAFLDAHRRDIRGAFLINLECVGAGTLSVYVREGLATRRRADRRLVRLIGDVARDLHIKVDNAMCDWTETDAATAMKARVRSATIVGLDDSDLPALSHTVDDVPENVNPKQVYDVVRIITEVIRRS